MLTSFTKKVPKIPPVGLPPIETPSLETQTVTIISLMTSLSEVSKVFSSTSEYFLWFCLASWIFMMFFVLSGPILL